MDLRFDSKGFLGIRGRIDLIKCIHDDDEGARAASGSVNKKFKYSYRRLMRGSDLSAVFAGDSKCED
ncbi:hypothetical protein KIN20_025252 [Parelaphostrongylus tenuis]|uniref:Uncharacterized protein n=1 Tax=Parelaphostrongylus tenuis TaxID=148309 RepID=A0AAD5NAM5_PARTN|nr:hypothetical protein KIN20_025252 [Parelaphostrongylus tenuis]